MLCSTCNGMRFVIKQEPRKYKQSGVTVTLGNLTTGISHICTDCQGTGLGINPHHDPSCTQCQGTGERNAWAAGEWETEPCLCKNPKPANPIERLYLSALEAM